MQPRRPLLFIRYQIPQYTYPTGKWEVENCVACRFIKFSGPKHNITTLNEQIWKECKTFFIVQCKEFYGLSCTHNVLDKMLPLDLKASGCTLNVVCKMKLNDE